MKSLSELAAVHDERSKARTNPAEILASLNSSMSRPNRVARVLGQLAAEVVKLKTRTSELRKLPASTVK
jgi:hypothetical protein